MRLYKIIVQHFSQKDEHTSIETILLAESDEQVYSWLDNKQYGMWSDREEDDSGYKDYLISVRGDYYDEDCEVSDLCYGATLYGWDELVSEDILGDAEVLDNLGLLSRVDDNNSQ